MTRSLWSSRLLRAIRIIAGAVLLTTCSTDTALAPRTRIESRFDASYLFQAGGEFTIPIDQVVLTLRRQSDSSVAFSRTLTSSEYAQSGGDLVITVTFELKSNPESFLFDAVAYSGGVEYYRASGAVTASANTSTTTPPITPTYTGPGATADSVHIPASTTLGGGQGTTLTADVYQGGSILSGVPVAFGSSDSTKLIPLSTGLNTATVTAPATGSGSVTITAKTPTGLTTTGVVRWTPPPATIVKISGDAQSVAVGTQAAQPLVVEVRDGSANPVAGVPVTFAVLTGPTGTTVAPLITTTDSVGRAQTILTAGTPAGAISVTAAAQGVATAVTFAATATQPVGAPTSVSANSAATQNGTVNQPVTAPPSVVVRDANALPVPGVPVTFAVTGGGGVLTGATQTTNASGIATVGSWRLGQTAGANTLTATVVSLTPASFSATGTATAALTVAKDSGDAQTGNPSTALANPLVVQVRDSFSNVVTGATVAWAATAGGGSLAPTSGPTDVNGRARATWTLGASGTQTATATVGALTPATFSATVNVGPPAITLAFVGLPDVGVGKTATVRATLSVAAGAGGVAVSLGSGATGTVTVGPPTSVTVPQGGTTADFTVNGIAIGSTTLTATATGYTNGTLGITVQDRAISVPATLNVPFGQTASLPINIGSPAPLGGVVITVTSSDTTLVGIQTPTVTIPQGGTSANAVVQGRLPGTVTVTVDNPAYTTDVSTVTTSASINILETFVNPNVSFPTGITLRFESNGVGIAAPAGGVVMTLTSRNTACAAVGSPRTIAQGQVTTTDSVSAGTGNTFPCTTYVVATAANLQPDSVQVTVNPIPPITGSGTVTLGAGLQVATSGFLGASNHGGVTVRVQSTDPARVLIAPNATTAGAPFIDIAIAAGNTGFSYTMQALDTVSTGIKIPVTMTAPGFSTGTTTDSLAPQAMDVIFLPTTATVFNPTSAFEVRLGTPSVNAQGVPVSMSTEQARRFGAPAETVTVVNDSAAVAALVSQAGTSQSATILIQPGSARSATSAAQGGVEFKPVGAGVTFVHASTPAAISIPQPTPKYQVTVSAPAITMSAVTAVGTGLMVSSSGFLGASNHGGVTVHLALSDSTRFKLGTSTTDQSPKGSLDIPLLNGNTGFSYVVQAIEGQPIGAATVTATAPGFTSGSTGLTSVQPALDVIFLPSTTTSLSPNSAFQIRVGTPNVGNTGMATEQAFRAGGPGAVATVAHSNPAAAKLFTTALTADTVTVPIAQQSARSPNPATNGGVEYKPVAPGVDSVSATIPGFISVPQPTPKYQITVTGQAITLSGMPTLASGLVTSNSGFLGASSYGSDTIHLAVLDSTKFRIAPNGTTLGTGTLDIVMTAPTTGFSYFIYPLEGQTGTDSVIATSKTGKFSRAAIPVTAVQPGFDIIFLNTTQTVFQPNNQFQVRLGVPNPGLTGLQQEMGLRFGSPGVTAALTSSAPNVGALVTSLGSGGTAQVPITAGNARSPGGGASVPGGVEFHPSIGGTTTVSGTIPGFATLPTATVTVTVNSPAITVSSPGTMAKNLMVTTSAFLGASNHPLDTLHLVVSDTTKFKLAPNLTTVPTGTLDIPMANGVTGASFVVHSLDSGTAIITASATGFTNGTTQLTALLPGLDIIFLNTNTTTFQPANPFQVRIGVPNTNNTGLQSEMALRFGVPAVTATVNNTNSLVGQLTFGAGPTNTGTVSIQPGTARSPSDTLSGGVAFKAIGVGSTGVTATIPGFVAQPGATQTVTVSKPAITISQVTVGSGLQVATSLFLGASQHGGVNVHLSSDNPALLFSKSATIAGATTLDTVLANGNTGLTYYVQGLENSNAHANVTATITGTAAGSFSDGTALDSIAPPGADIIFLPTSVSAGAANVNFSVRLGIPDQLGNSLNQEQVLRAGGPGTVTATVTNSNAIVAQLVDATGNAQTVTTTITTNTARSPGGGPPTGLAFDPLTQGATAVSIQGITGLPNLRILPSSTVNVTVGP